MKYLGWRWFWFSPWQLFFFWSGVGWGSFYATDGGNGQGVWIAFEEKLKTRIKALGNWKC